MTLRRILTELLISCVRLVRAIEIGVWFAYLRWVNSKSDRRVAGGSGPVVSMTTYGKRLASVHLTIESIGRGRILPSRLILWLDEEEAYAHPPVELSRLVERGLEIRHCPNYGPHKKYYPYVESEPAFIGPLVTADDDVLYPRFWLAGLVAALSRYPGCVCCYRARTVTFDGDALAPYRDWPATTSDAPSYRTFAIGVSGVLYPPAVLGLLKSSGTGFETVCPRADDIWLHAHALRAGCPIALGRRKSTNFRSLPGSQVGTLTDENVDSGGNDRQIAATYTEADIARIRGD